MFIPSIEVTNVVQTRQAGTVEHVPDGFLLLFALDHLLRFRLSGHELLLKRHDIYLFRNNADLEIESCGSEADSAIFVWFRVKDANLRQMLQLIGPKLHVDAIYARSCILNIRNARSLQPDCFRDCIGYYILSLLFYGYIAQKKPGSPLASLNNGVLFLPSSNETLNQILNYIDDHIAEEITVHQLSSAFLKSAKQLDELFKCEYGCTIMQFVSKFRLFKAKELMCYTNHSITEISDMTGFGSIHYFSRYFKEKECMSPTEYRRLFFQSEKECPLKPTEPSFLPE